VAAIVFQEIVVHPEMVAAGVEAMHEARRKNFSDGDLVLDIYLAMVGQYYKSLDQQETIQ
jgi:hypothetical protein